jgi:SAM-dependent methyltransferase
MSYRVTATQEINDGLGVKDTILNASAVLFRKFKFDNEFRTILEGMHIAGDWYFIVHAIKDGEIHYQAEKLNYHRRHSGSVIAKTVSGKRLIDFYQEFHMVQQFIIQNFELDHNFYKKWDTYMHNQWNDFCPNRPFNELKNYYPVDEMKYRILSNAGVLTDTIDSQEDPMFLKEYKSVCINVAQRLGVSANIHPEDFIFHFLFDNPTFQSKEQAVEYYFNDGSNSAKKLLSILKDICGFGGEQKLRLLEFASGYGCVTRHINQVIPFCINTACDIHQQAVQFISDKLGVHAVISSSVPEQLRVTDEYEIVFALSFFSHMPEVTWTRWFNTLLSKVKKGGFLIFTTHGWLSRKYFGFPEFDRDGFWYAKQSEQKDLDTSEYGSTVVTPLFVFQQAARNPDGRIIFFKEGYWWEHQDLYVVKHESGPGHHPKEIMISPKESQPDFDDGLIPPTEMMFDGASTVEDFKNLGEGFVRYFLIEHAKLNRSDKVLDVGCGIGQKARALTKYLDHNGTYEGFDIVPSGIHWCKEKYQAYPNFHFHLADIYNKHFNPNGKLKASQYQFPFPDDMFDLAFLSSVFTHMIPEDMSHYLREIARVLRRQGKCVITFFLLNLESLRGINAKRNTIHVPFKHSEGCYINNREIPETTVAYDEMVIRDLFQKSGLSITEVTYGSWSGRKEFNNMVQDIIIAVKV